MYRGAGGEAEDSVAQSRRYPADVGADAEISLLAVLPI